MKYMAWQKQRTSSFSSNNNNHNYYSKCNKNNRSNIYIEIKEFQDRLQDCGGKLTFRRKKNKNKTNR